MLPNSDPRFQAQYDAGVACVGVIRVHDGAVQRLEEALAEQDRLGISFDAAVGTSTEYGAYARLQRAGEQVAARETWLNWVDNESHSGTNAGPDPLDVARWLDDGGGTGDVRPQI